jgi:hypothetical protein
VLDVGAVCLSDRRYLPMDLYVPEACSEVLVGRVEELAAVVLGCSFLLWAENMASSCLK